MSDRKSCRGKDGEYKYVLAPFPNGKGFLFYGSVSKKAERMLCFIELSEVNLFMPSAKVLESKKARVEALSEMLKGATAGVIVDYKGITVEEDTKLRKELREAGVNYFVEKNSMLRFAVKNVGLDGLADVLEGTTAIAITDGDETAPARILGKFAEDAKDKFNLKAGFIGQDIYDQQGVVALSKIPSKETLLAQLLGSLQAPMQNLAATLQALVDKKKEEEVA